MNLASTLLLAAVAIPHSDVKYVLPKNVVVTDSARDSRLSSEALSTAFREHFEAQLRGSVLILGKDAILSPDEPVVMVLPIVTTARVSHEVTAGTIHEFTAIVAGAVSLVDPWTNSTIFSATRLVEARRELGASDMADLDRTMKQAFGEASVAWMDACIEQVRRAAPFVIKAETVTIDGFNGPGGAWPAGSESGVRAGRVLQGLDGRRAKVVSVQPKHSVIEDAANSQRRIGPGEGYRLTIVDRPADRPEPRVGMKWVGNWPSQEFDQGVVMPSRAALVDFMASYLSKRPGLRLLPASAGSILNSQEFEQFNQEVSRFAALVPAGNMTLQRETAVQAASERPAVLIEVGFIEAYHGQRARDHGVIEHLYRVTLAATVRTPMPKAKESDYPIRASVTHQAEVGVVEMKDVRVVRPADLWFTASRNAAVRLAEKLSETIRQVVPPDSGTALPVVGVSIRTPQRTSALVEDGEWVDRLTAGQLAKSGFGVIIGERASQYPPIEISIDKVVSGETPLNAVGEWRGTARKGIGSDSVLRFGVRYQQEAPATASKVPLSPPDISGQAFEFTTEGAKALVQQASEKGLGRFFVNQ